MKQLILDFVIMHPPGLGLPQRFCALLREHPGLCFTPEDTKFFSSDALKKGRSWYEEQFADCGEGTKRGECSTSYLSAPGVPARLSREYPKARLVAVIENPLVAISEHYTKATSGHPSPPPLEAFLERSPLLLSEFLYGRQLVSFFGYYSPVDLLVLTGDDVRENPSKVVTEVYTHLEVDVHFVPKVLRVLTEEETRPGFWARRLRLDKLRAYHRARRLATASAVFPPTALTLSTRERVLLSRFYEKDVRTLSDLLHRDLVNEWQLLSTDAR